MRSPRLFIYKYNEGPLSLKELKAGKFTVGNCRRAVQDYLYSVFGLYLEPAKILLPEGYLHTGVFVFKNQEIDWSRCRPGDIIYAQRIKSLKKEIIDYHTAIFVDQHYVYHATSVSGKTCTWTIEEFQEHYKIIAVKRVLPS